MSIFEYEDYKAYVLSLVREMPNHGYGQFRKIAQHFNVSSVIVSQIFKGPRHLSAEQALDLARYFGLSDLETEYFVLLVGHERAGNHRLKAHYKKRMDQIRDESMEIKARVPRDKLLSEEAKAIFYSNWYYSAVRLLSSVDGNQTIEALSENLNLPRSTVKRIAEFLVMHGLCVEDGGNLTMGPQATHLEAASPLVTRHHTNWRLRGLQNMEPLRKDELFYSAPMVLSHQAVTWVRKEILELIERIAEQVKASKSETLACLNIDWFDFRDRPKS